jgi:hypothetical protein
LTPGRASEGWVIVHHQDQVHREDGEAAGERVLVGHSQGYQMVDFQTKIWYVLVLNILKRFDGIIW